MFNQTVLDALYDPTARHEQIVPWHNDGKTKQLYMVTSFLFHEKQKIGALSIAIDERSHYNANHTRNMVTMAEAFLDWMESHGHPWQYDEERRRGFIMSVGLHDIG